MTEDGNIGNHNKVNPNPLIHGSWAGIGEIEKSCCRAMRDKDGPLYLVLGKEFVGEI